MDITKYLIDEALILIPVLFIIGAIIKQTPKFYDWVIPYVLLILGVVLSMFLVGFNVDGVIQGVLVSGASVFGNELFKQFNERDED